MQKYFKQFITSILILSFVVPLPLVTKNASAQTQGAYSTDASYGGGSAGIGGYLKGIAPAITQLPLCKGKIQGVVSGLFTRSGVGDAVDSLVSDEENDRLALGDEEFERQQQIALEEAESIEVVEKELRREAVKTARKLNDIEALNKSLEQNDTCFKSIGRMVTKLVLQKITVSTVAWIQGGFDGKPAFIQNPESFFTDIAKNEILQFGLEINNETLYPFGKAFMRSQAEAFNSHFAQNAQYSLNELIQNTTPQYSDISFQEDFSAGGWNAWTALTSVPANNPLGFQLMASNELSRRLEGTYQAPAVAVQKALDQASGYLGDQRCVEPRGVTKEQHRSALEAGDTTKTCKRWEYVTPGKMISEAATTALNYPSNNLLKSDDLNDAVAAILDALLSRFSSDLMNKGFADFSNEGADGAFVLNAAGLLSTGASTQTEKDFSRFQLGGQWLQDHPNFNIRTDVTQALIDEQRIYRTKLEEQNKVLKDLNKTIYQLDYCIPGPHPGFEQDSREVLSAVENSIVSKTANDMRNLKVEEILGLVKVAGYVAGAAIGAAIGTAVFPGFGTAVGAAIGFVVGFVTDFVLDPNDEEKLDIYYAGIFKNLTGVHMSKKNTKPAKIGSKHEITIALDSILIKYTELINKYFPIESLPTVAKDAAKEFRKTVGYNQIIKENNDKIILLNSIIKRLTTIKDGIQKLNDQYPGASTGDATNQNAYELALEDFKSEFSRLAQNMVTGDDIAVVDNLTKQAKDEIKYVYDDLLTGEYGCEKDLALGRQLSPDKPLHPLLKGTIRATYPFPIWYDYKPGTQLLVPEELKIYTQKTTGNALPSATMQNGPGFLSSVYFDNSAESCSSLKSNSFVLDCIEVTEFFREVNKWTVTVGVNSLNFGNWFANKDYEQKNTSFEQTIGVY